MLRRGDACFRNEVIDATNFAAKTWQSDQFEWPTGGIEMKIAFDIGGVLGKHPKVFRPLVCALRSGGVEVYVLTDIPDQASAERVLRKHGYDFSAENILCCDYLRHGDRCKGVVIEQFGIDVLIDDHPAYCAASGCLSLLLWPDTSVPYEAPVENEIGQTNAT